MGAAWTLTVLGARGSLPASGADFLDYGGSTSCFLVDWGSGQAILDAGSGLARLTGKGPWHILLSHLHMDHISGLFGFSPFQDSAADIYLYGPAGFRSRLERLVGPPFWPVGLATCEARLLFCEASPAQHFFLPGSVEVSVLAGRHPNGSLLYRLSDGSKTLVYALDCELVGDMAERLTAFAQEADLLIWDASFAPEDLRPGWGHSTWAEGIALGQAAGIKQVLMTHYDRAYTDSFLLEQEALAHQTSDRSIFAREGMTIAL